MPISHIGIWGLAGSTVFFYTNGTIFGGKKITENKMLALIFSTCLDRNLPDSKKKISEIVS